MKQLFHLLFLFSVIQLKTQVFAAYLHEKAETYRYDTVDIWKKNILKRVKLDSAVIKPSFQKSLSANESPFDVTYDCTKISASMCNKAKYSMQIAINEISKGIQVKTQVKVKASFYPFCGNKSPCALKDALGQAASAAYFIGRFNQSEQYAYIPQSIVKQYERNINAQFAPFDILAEFNTDFDFWYESDGIPVTSSSIALSFVAAHEITHGLGVDSFLYPSSFFYPSALKMSEDVISPTVVFDEQGRIASESTWDTVQIFDQQLFDEETNTTLHDWYNKMFQFRKPVGYSLQAFYDEFDDSGEPWEAALNITTSLTTKQRRVKFITESHNCSYPYISTFAGFSPGSSIAHLDHSTYKNTADFLMTHTISGNVGFSLEDLIKKYSADEPMYGVFGPRTLNILSTIGWSTVLRETPYSMCFLSQTYGIDNEAITTDPGPRLDYLASEDTCPMEVNTIEFDDEKPTPIERSSSNSIFTLNFMSSLLFVFEIIAL